MSPPLRIPIIGAGTVGPVLAIALKRSGHLPVLYDHIAQAGDVGGGINFAPNGLRLIKDLGFLDEFMANGTPLVRADIGKLDGRPITSFSGDAIAKKYGIPSVGIRRSRMHSLFLKKAQEAGIPIHLGKHLSSITQPKSTQLGVTAKFTDGTEADGDILVGADGINSITRTAVFGDEPPPTFTGIEAIIGISNYKDAAVTRILQGGGKQFGMYGIGNGDEVVWFVGYRQKQEDLVKESWETDGEGVAAREAGKLEEMFMDWGLEKEFAEVVGKSKRIIRYGIFDREPRVPWSLGNVVLIGDAAHPMPPHLGQGGNTALEDAGVLSELIRRLYPISSESMSNNDALRKAFEVFESLRSKRTADITKSARELGKINSIESPLLCALRDAAQGFVIWANGGVPPLDALYGYNYKAEVAMALEKRGL
ncbi:hypothetical protein HDU67_005007 [Dinochytrium kinnereticum]|nr:hypothetical protein HDU67_005007 [Dinochytrium kinnereticum]